MIATSQSTEPMPAFDDGLEVLRGYHRVMLDQCNKLRSLATQVEFKNKESDFNNKAVDIYHYFSVATAQHHADEEQELFPLLSGASCALLSAMMDRLEEDHQELEQVWDYLGPLLKQAEVIVDQREFCQVTRRFTQLLTWHIAREEDNFLPEVEKILSMAQRRVMGAKMAKNRSLLGS